MSIEEELFKKAQFDFSKLLSYGFKKENDVYLFSQNINNNHFKVDIKINKKGLIKGNIYDLNTKEEYTNFRLQPIPGIYAQTIKEAYQTILKDIKEKCCKEDYFVFKQTNRITKFIFEEYKDKPNFEWENAPRFATFKNKDTNKWYGLIMNIDASKINNKTRGEVEIINIKLDPEEINTLLQKEGFYPAYHMNKKNWISIILDDTLLDNEIIPLIKESYSYTLKKKKIYCL